jgi:hypothetical protein
MELYEVNENEIIEELNEVTTAKRVASMVSFHLTITMHCFIHNITICIAITRPTVWSKITYQKEEEVGKGKLELL